MTLSLNEDNSHFYARHPREEMTVSGQNVYTMYVNGSRCPLSGDVIPTQEETEPLLRRVDAYRI